MVKLLLIIALVFPCCVAAQNDVYRLGPGDTLFITVYQEADLSFPGKISQQGFIDFPLLGNIKLNGRTQAEAKSHIEKLLKDGYLVAPRVSIRVTHYRPFFIYGEVRSPGSYTYQPDITIEQVIALSGGLKDRASRKDWTIQRGLNKTVFQANAETIIQPGDVIKINKSFF
ncbi:MAG: polysaccharide export protein [Psychrobium sp.]|nr:polysaccharide export protein [Psychrobium sp.]